MHQINRLLKMMVVMLAALLAGILASLSALPDNTFSNAGLVLLVTAMVAFVPALLIVLGVLLTLEKGWRRSNITAVSFTGAGLALGLLGLFLTHVIWGQGDTAWLFHFDQEFLFARFFMVTGLVFGTGWWLAFCRWRGLALIPFGRKGKSAPPRQGRP